MNTLLAFLALTSPALADSDPFAVVPANVMALHQRVNGAGCEYGQAYADDSIGADATKSDLGQGWSLYLIPCGAGAYQTSFRAYVGKGDRAEQLFFVSWMNGGVFATPSLSDATFENGQLRSHMVGRSIGDCGEDAYYKLNVVDDYRVEVTVDVIRAKEECDENMDPWPVVFRGK